MRIAYLIAGYSDPQYEALLKRKLQDAAGENHDVFVEAVSSGPFTLEHRYCQSLVVPDLAQRAYSLRDSIDAVVMGGGLDPAVREARELVEIPVVGAGEAGLHIAAMLGGKFSVLTGRRSLVPKVEALVRGHGLQSRLASIQATSLTVQDPSADDRRKPSQDREGYHMCSTRAWGRSHRLGLWKLGGGVRRLARTLLCPIGRLSDRGAQACDTPG